MTKNPTTLIEQLTPDEQKELEWTIQKLFSVSLIPRDKIKEKLIGLMNLKFRRLRRWMET